MDEEIVQVIMQQPVLRSFQEWLCTRGLHVNRTQYDPDDIPTYSVVISNPKGKQ